MGAIRANEVTAIRIGVFHAAHGAGWDCVVRHIEILTLHRLRFGLFNAAHILIKSIITTLLFIYDLYFV
jgi:hypothetical protein